MQKIPYRYCMQPMLQTEHEIFINPRIFKSFAGVRSHIKDAVKNQPDEISLVEALSQINNSQYIKKTMEREILINYSWWKDDKTPIKPEHEEALDESAREHIFRLMADGFYFGVLSDNIHMTKNDPKDGIEYKGWWEAKIT